MFTNASSSSTIILQAVVTIATALITGFLIPWLKKKLSSEKLNKVLTYVNIFVEAAEQLYNQDQGAEKKAYVVQKLNDMGFDVTLEEMDSIIEAAVLTLHNALKDTATITTTTATATTATAVTATDTVAI